MAEDIKKEKAEVKSFRVTDEVVAKLKELQSPGCPTTDSVLRMLINTYELELAKEVIPERKTEITNFQMKARGLVEAYLHSVELNQDAEARIRLEFVEDLNRNKKTIDNCMTQIDMLKEQKRALEEDARKAGDLQRDLVAARARVGEVEADAKQRLDDLRTTNDSLMGDKKRLEAEVQKCQEQIAGMQAAVASFEAMKAERDNALAKVEEERRASQEAQKQTVEATRQAMQEQVNAINDRLHEAVVAQTAAQAEANSLREFKAANDKLHETVGEQKAKIAMLEDQAATLEARANLAEQKAAAMQEKNQKQADQIMILQAKIEAMKSAASAGADGQTAIDGI